LAGCLESISSEALCEEFAFFIAGDESDVIPIKAGTVSECRT
jgi:hypothetical protein